MADRGEIIWQPRPGAWETSRIGSFAAVAGEAVGSHFGDYESLLSWSLDDSPGFWAAFADWSGVRWLTAPATVLTNAEGATHGLPGARWFEGATLNYAEHALAKQSSTIVGLSQSRPRAETSNAELIEAVGRCQRGLLDLGVQRGDRVVAYAPNITETIVVFLATAGIGAVFSSCAPEFGVRAVVDRWSQLEPVVMVAADGYQYGERRIERAVEIAEIVAALPSLRALVVVTYLAGSASVRVEGTVRCLSWSELCGQHCEVTFEAVPFDHPLYILFSSGTTGLPKPIVHGHGGILLEHLKVLGLHHDLGTGSRFMWFTTTGWMMWNYLVSGLALGCTIVLFDGDPAFPSLGNLWQVAADERLDVLGVSAPFLMACRKDDLRPGELFDLSRLGQVGSTGAPLPADGFRWVTDAVGSHIQVASVSGGTDVCTAFVGAAPVVPVRAGEISVRMLGCDVQALDPDGNRCPDGVTGELVIAQPMPSMPVGLWGDASGERYRSTYFETFPGYWHHGDWITFRPDGSCEITGRSDATLNRGGVRLGTSDFYAVVESMPEVADSVVVHLEDASGGPGTLILLVACAGGSALDDSLRASIGAKLRRELSPRHVPDVIDQVPAIPRTLSGKKLEVPIKRLLLGQTADKVASRGSLVDPAALDSVAAWAAAYQAGTQTKQ